MKVLLVGSDNIWSIERLYLNHLRELGVDAELFPAQNMFVDRYNRSVLTKLLFRSGLLDLYTELNRDLLERAGRDRYDIAWVFKGMEILPASLKQLRNLGTRLVNYNPDNPFVFSGSGSGNQNVTNSVSLFDLHLTYDHAVEERLRKEFRANTEILPFGFELDHNSFRQASEVSETSRLCFLGNPDKERSAFIESLAAAGIPVDVYGHGWKRHIKSTNISVYNAVYGADFWSTLRKYRVQLNLMRPHNPFSHNMRSFEIPAVGGIMLAPVTDDHKRFFEPGKEAFFFTNLENCIATAKALLAMPDSDAWHIRTAARERSVRSLYSYKDRAAFVKGVFENLLNG